MKTSNKILIAYVASMFVFYVTVGVLNMLNVKHTRPLGEGVCRELDRHPVRVVDLRGAVGCQAFADRGARQSQLQLRMPLEAGTLTLRGDTLVVRGGEPGKFFGATGPQSQIRIPMLTTVIDRDGVRELLPQGQAAPTDEASAAVGAVGADHGQPAQAASDPVAQPASARPNP